MRWLTRRKPACAESTYSAARALPGQLPDGQAGFFTGPSVAAGGKLVGYAATAANLVQGDDNAGRLTAMGAGGSVEDNIKRWADQFAGEGGAAKPKLDKVSAAGAEIQLVDLAGTYKDSPGGPFAGGKTIMRNNYRMLGAIIQTKDKGNYFLKLYGPKATITPTKSRSTTWSRASR